MPKITLAKKAQVLQQVKRKTETKFQEHVREQEVAGAESDLIKDLNQLDT